MLDSDIRLNRPVGWLKHHFYASPMHEGIRMAGTAEFCAPDKAPSAVRWSRLAEWGETLFGRSLKVGKQWVGVRHSTPDGLPVVGSVPGHEGLIMAFGHGHLGLTLSAETARIVAGIVEGDHLPSYAQSLSPQRFL
jgi:D-amino-acid dehydrogenase